MRPEGATSLAILHRSPFDLQQMLEPAGRHRRLHRPVGAARTHERIQLALCQALVGLAHRLVHRGEGAPGRGRQAITETGEVARRQREFGESVGRRERHQRRRQALADDAHLLGRAREHEQHVGARLVEGFRAAQRLVEIVDPPCIGAGDDHEVGIGARRQRFLDLLDHESGRHQVIDADVMLDPPRQQLILDLDCGDARRLAHRDRAAHVDRVAPTPAGVEDDRQLAYGPHVHHDLDHLGQRQVGLGDAFEPAERTAAQIERLEPCLLGEPRHDRIERHRGNDEAFAAHELSELFQAKAPFDAAWFVLDPPSPCKSHSNRPARASGRHAQRSMIGPSDMTLRWRAAVLAILVAVCTGGLALAQTSVDLQLVLAVDASGSVNQYRFDLQKQGYAEAFRNPRVLKAIRSGIAGAIAVTVVQWTGPDLQIQVIDWTLVKDERSANAFAAAIEDTPRQLFSGGTSVSGAIDHAVTLLLNSARDYPGARRTIDVSGDGANNRGRPAHLARDDAVRAGITINGLPILALEPGLDRYYYDNVIGGPGAFMVTAQTYETFAEAVLKKLITEIAVRPSNEVAIQSAR